MEPENFLHHMRKRSVTDIMKQSCRASGCAIIFVDAVLFTQSIQYTCHQVKCAQRMCKSRMLGALVGVEAKTELFDAAQPLEFKSINQPHHQLTFARIGSQANDVVHRIAIDALCHYGFLIRAKTFQGNTKGGEVSCRANIRAICFW